MKAIVGAAYNLISPKRWILPKHWIAGPIVTIAAGSLAQVGAQTPVVAHTDYLRVSAQQTAERSATPSTLDYVVLASLADASSLLSLSAYRAPATAPVAARRHAAPTSEPQPGE